MSNPSIRVRKLPVEVTAVPWYKNGDHPEDYKQELVDPVTGRISPPEYQRINDWEGQVVRRYRHPYVSGDTKCSKCDQVMNDHGWIDTLEDGHAVCPGDWVITGVQGERYPCKPDVFAKSYEIVGNDG